MLFWNANVCQLHLKNRGSNALSHFSEECNISAKKCKEYSVLKDIILYILFGKKVFYAAFTEEVTKLFSEAP